MAPRPSKVLKHRKRSSSVTQHSYQPSNDASRTGNSSELRQSWHGDQQYFHCPQESGHASETLTGAQSPIDS